VIDPVKRFFVALDVLVGEDDKIDDSAKDKQQDAPHGFL
jgi:hypothetical protein